MRSVRGLAVVVALAMVGAGCGGDEEGESSAAPEPATMEELKAAVDAYQAETPLGEKCAWRVVDNGAISGAASMAEGAVAAEELACDGIIPVEIAEFPDEARATDVAGTLEAFRSGTLVVDGPYGDEAFYDRVQEECGECGEVPAA